MTAKTVTINNVQDEVQNEVQKCGGMSLVIRLDTDDCKVIRTGSGEQAAGCGISEKASEWFRNYAVRGYVHEDDLAAYLLFTERSAMRRWFETDRDKKVLEFRSRIGREFRRTVLEIVPDEEFSGIHPVVQATISPLPL